MADEHTDPKKPRHLTVVRPGDVVEPVRRWWKARGLDSMDTSLPQALNDVALMALAHIAKRLDDPKTPLRVKDQMAMVMGPKIGIVLGRGGSSHDVPASTQTRGVLDVYRTRS